MCFYALLMVYGIGRHEGTHRAIRPLVGFIVDLAQFLRLCAQLGLFAHVWERDLAPGAHAGSKPLPHGRGSVSGGASGAPLGGVFDYGIGFVR
jgi:hypothetical protein